MRGFHALLMHGLTLATLVACGAGTAVEPDGPERVRTETDAFGLITCSAETETHTCFTHRAILGVSMGAGGAGNLAFSRPELFDSVGLLGSPLVDWVAFFRNVERGYMAGFCDRETILENLDSINDPDGAAFCGAQAPVERITPGGEILEPPQHFNDWYRWIDEGRGGSFGRNKIRESLQDISLAYGNAYSYNPESPYYPAGIPMDFRNWSQEDKCGTPFVVENVYHHRYNPDGEYPAIALCDTNTNSGLFDPTRPAERATEVLLAIDYNRNGIRDFSEPVLVSMHEQYEDIGGGPDDTYDWLDNPTGRAGNWRYDDGEPFEDFGLDGVPNTGDFGEGDGQFNLNPNLENFYDQNPRHLLEKMDEDQLSRLNIWADAGIRDFLYSAIPTNWLWGSLQARVGASNAPVRETLNGLTPELSRFDFLSADFSPDGLGKHVYLQYGDIEADERKINRGDGHHVGTIDQVLNRFLASLGFVEQRFYVRHQRAIDTVGEITDLVQSHTFPSDALGEDREFGIMLPPGYNLPENAEKRYPVAYFLHGQGMESSELLASSILFFGYQSGSTREEVKRARKSDWAQFIIVFPDSTCHADACGSGNFNSNHRGLDGTGRQYNDSLYELMAHVEQTWRTAVPVEVEKASLPQ